MKKFCPNCGTPLKDGATFCPNCGAKITQNSAPKTPQSAPQQVPTRSVQRKPVQHKPMSKKNKIIWSIIATFAVIFIGLYIFGNQYYSRDRQIARIVNAVKSSKGDLSKYVLADDSNVKVTADSVEPYKKLLATEKSDKLQSNLTDESSVTNGELVENGKYFLLFPKYQLKVQTYQPKVTTNHADSVLYINGDKSGKFSNDSDNNYYNKENRLLAGKYTFLVKSKISGRNLQASSTVDVSKGDIDMGIETQTFMVKSIPGANIFINDKKIGTVGQDGKVTFENYPITKNMDFYVTTKVGKKDLPSTTIHDFGEAVSDNYNGSSDQVDTSDDDVVVTPEWPGMISDDDAKSLFQGTFDDPDSDDFVNGSSNTTYKDITKMEKGFDDNDDISNVDYEVEVESITPAADETSKVDYKVTYKFDHDDYTNTQVMEYKGATVKKDGDNYKIDYLGNGKLISSKKTDNDD